MLPDPGVECLDGSTVAALVAGGLGVDGLERVELHLARCTDCAELVCAAAALADDQPPSSPTARGLAFVDAVDTASEWRSLLLRLQDLLRPGSPPPAQPGEAARPGRLRDRYELGELIAQGASGLVYRGQDRQSGVPVAIKRLKQNLGNESPEALARFLLEGQILRRLNHPNIVQLLDMVEDGAERYLVMEYVAGGSLRAALPRGRALSVQRAVTITLELADALSRAHHLHVLHRDVKPENVLLAEDGTPRLSDFGLGAESSRLADTGTSAPALLGPCADPVDRTLLARVTRAVDGAELEADIAISYARALSGACVPYRSSRLRKGASRLVGADRAVPSQLLRW